MHPAAARFDRLLAALRRTATHARDDAAVAGPARSDVDRLGALLARRVRLPVSLRVTPDGGIEAAVPALPECRVRGDTCEAALGRLRAAVVARLLPGRAPPGDDGPDGARPADAAPSAGCAWTEIVVVVDGDAVVPGSDRLA
jgi:hypothetical protein